MNFSVLMSLYNGEQEDFLNICLESLYKQTLPPSEIVIVFDGPIRDELESIVAKWELVLPIFRVILSKCSGLGNALNEGLKFCNYDIICRMDTDDVCHPSRFEKQVCFFNEHPEVSIVGSWVGEFDETTERIHAVRKVPVEHADIITYAKKRNPFNHMAIAYKKSAVLSACAYQDDYLYEDYALWVRMIQNGVVTANLHEVLVYARTGNGMELRRGGVAYFFSELKVQYRFYKTGLINIYEFIRNIVIRLPVRLLPGKFRKYIYRSFLR
jgi:glycosyltransferase involved in cell wall biosynthesis